MKIKRSLVVGCLTALLGVGAAVGAGFAAEKGQVKEAEAATSYGNIYFNADYESDTNAVFGVWAWHSGSSGRFYGLNKIGDSKIYTADLPLNTGIDTYIFFRMSAAQKSSALSNPTSWPSFWNRSAGDMTTGGYNQFNFTGYSNSEMTGSWSRFETTIGYYAKVYRFKPQHANWGNNCYVSVRGSATSSNNCPSTAGSGGINISQSYYYDDTSTKVYYFATNVTDYTTICFYNGSGWNTDATSIGSNKAWWNNGGNSLNAFTVTNNTYYFYDYRNLMSGVKCYAFSSNGPLHNYDYPGQAMTSVQYGSGQLYSISLDPVFDRAKFGLGDGNNTGDQWINQKDGNPLSGSAFVWWNVGDSAWVSADHARAHDWIFQTMKLRTIDTDDNRDTGACRGSEGYYAKAKDAYDHFSDGVKTELAKIDGYANAQARFVAWAAANGKTASFSGTTLTVTGMSNTILPGLNSEAETGYIWLIVSIAISAIAVGGFFFIKRRKHDR